MQRSGQGRGKLPWGTSGNSPNTGLNSGKQNKLQLPPKKPVYDDSSEEEENEDSGNILEKLVGRYTELGGGDMGRTKEFLYNSFQSGAGVCLICISSVKRADPIWNCIGCYGFFHIICIQKWARDNLFQQKQAMEELPVFKRSTVINWGCPKCRRDYSEKDVPTRYWCFCGKSEDPSYHPWLVPHSCGEHCGKSLVPDCGHRCLLLCHPGPCPPCPKTIQTYCYCGKTGPLAKRCSEKLWSCFEPCGKLLACKKHTCPVKCHSGPCSPCLQRSVQDCDCGQLKTMRPCSEPMWKCEKVCSKPFLCGYHKCEVKCHSGECGECPLSLARTCPCGKTAAVYACTQEISTCNDTCDKLLDCGVHRCQLKCHKDKCACLEIITKVCRCGLHRKDVPCGKEYTCESKCKKSKSCQKHPCNKKCCDGECGPCEKPCGRTLTCGTHKCPSVCHRGPCYPCPQASQVRCRCGLTAITVPCGREKRTRPPKCKLTCKIPPDCHHPSRDMHKCHFGNCPACTQVCNKVYDGCGHACQAACHTSVWLRVEDHKVPAGPWELLEPTFRRQTLPCPPCATLVPIACIGEHEITSLPCCNSTRVSCGRPCGRNLPCGNHVCEIPCHSSLETCEECEEGCSRPPAEGCTHPCLRACHPEPCERPCRELVKVSCHCRITTLYVECYKLNDKEKSLSCGNKCPNNLVCGHKCKANCHAGPCPDPDACRKKTKLSCPCGRLRKEVPCDVVRRGEARVVCDEVCENKKEQLKLAKEQEKAREQEEIARKNREELEKFEKKMHGKKAARERNRQVEVEHKTFLEKHKILLIVVSLGVVLIAYFALL